MHMPHRVHSNLIARLTRTEQDLLDRVPLENRGAVLRRMLAALSETDARGLIDALRRRPDAATWLEGLREVA
jgi:hypothetical protein